MGGINFLNNKSANNKTDKIQMKKADNVLWSKPAVVNKIDNKKNVFSILDFTGKNKNIKKHGDNSDDKSKIEYSRQEVLKLAEQDKKRSLRNKQEDNRQLRKPGVFNAWLKSIFNFNKNAQKNKKSFIKTAYIGLPEVKAPEVKTENIIKNVGLPEIKHAEKIAIFNNVQQNKIKAETVSSKAVIKKQEQATIKHQLLREAEELKSWENPNIIKTNLIKGELVSYFDWKVKIAVLIKVIILSCSIVGLACAGLFFLQKQKDGNGSKEILVKKNILLEEQVVQAEKSNEKIVIFQNKLSMASALLNKHIYWTNFFKFLEENTIADVYYAGFSGDTGGKYVFSAMTKNYASISRQINAMKANSHVISARADGGKISGQGKESSVNFSLNLEINPDIFNE